MSFDDLCSENIMLYAIKVYDKPNCIMSEFKEDMKRFNYLKRLFFRHRKTGEIKERLILNHIIILKNMFGAKNCCRILFFKLPEELHSPLKSFFDYLNYTPASIPETYINSIQSDENVLKILRETL